MCLRKLNLFHNFGTIRFILFDINFRFLVTLRGVVSINVALYAEFMLKIKKNLKEHFSYYFRLVKAYT